MKILGHNKKYYPQLDSLRAIACLSVMLFHFSTRKYCHSHGIPFFDGGFIGVDLFFVLSGFIISTILVKQYAETGNISIINFYKKRALRLYPPIIITVFVFVVPLLFVDPLFAISNIFFLVTYTGDIVRLFQIIIPALQYPIMFSHCWSLAIEEQFYLFYPALALATFNFCIKRNKNVISSFLIFNIIFIIVIITSNVFVEKWFYKFFLWRFFQILYGAYIALIFSKDYENTFVKTKTSIIIQNFVKKIYTNKYVYIICALIFIFTLNSISLLHYFLEEYQLHYYVLVFICSVLILNAMYPRYAMVNAILENKVLIYLGKISYGLYLYHIPFYYLNIYMKVDESTLGICILQDINTHRCNYFIFSGKL